MAELAGGREGGGAGGGGVGVVAVTVIGLFAFAQVVYVRTGVDHLRFACVRTYVLSSGFAQVLCFWGRHSKG